jgi:hypothetical protein
MQGAPFTRNDGRRNSCPSGGIDEVDAVTIESKCAGAFDLGEHIRPEAEEVERSAYDSDLARHINRDNVQRASDGVGSLIGAWPVGGWRRVDAATVATFETSAGQA